jgi:hypothetical protein
LTTRRRKGVTPGSCWPSPRQMSFLPTPPRRCPGPLMRGSLRSAVSGRARRPTVSTLTN